MYRVTVEQIDATNPTVLGGSYGEKAKIIFSQELASEYKFNEEVLPEIILLCNRKTLQKKVAP